MQTKVCDICGVRLDTFPSGPRSVATVSVDRQNRKVQLTVTSGDVCLSCIRDMLIAKDLMIGHEQSTLGSLKFAVLTRSSGEYGSIDERAKPLPQSWGPPDDVF